LNVFQRMMLRWSDLHPYSAVHVVHLDRPLPGIRLAERIAGALEAHGLTGLVLDPRRRRFRYEGGPAEVALEVLPGGSDPVAVVCSEVERQLNAPFPHAHRANPFRFFAVVADDSFHLGLAYDHFIAGGDAIALLLKDIAAACTAAPPPCGPAPDLYPWTYRSLLARHPWAFAKGLFSLPGLIATSRRSFRPRYQGGGAHNGFACFRLGPGQLAALRRAGKAWGVTLNDLFLASLLLALSPLAAERRQAHRRRELAVASIVNARADFGTDPRGTFGQFLASFRVAHPVPEGIGLRELAQDVHAETTRAKREKLYLQTILALSLAGLIWPFLSVRRREGFFAKYHPAWGGVSALNVSDLWSKNGADNTQSLDYLRAASTGPLCPVVFAVTTVRDTLHVGVSYRTAAFSRATVDGVAAGFIRCIDSLTEADACTS
jgi:hypothetical protein